MLPTNRADYVDLGKGSTYHSNGKIAQIPIKFTKIAQIPKFTAYIQGFGFLGQNFIRFPPI
jgi:hypothetical protein